MGSRVKLILNHLRRPDDCDGNAADISGVLPQATAGIRMSGGGKDEIIRRVKMWHKYVFEIVPKKIASIKAEKRKQATEFPWAKQEYDVVVLGYGGAGSSAAIDAADLNNQVLLVDRFEGGGSTRRSGGVYYAGGGTRAQKEAGIDDNPENMFKYIRKENDGAVDDQTIRDFCKQSPETFSWLEDRVGMNFRSNGKTQYYPKKTSYPPSFTTLYQSGNESAHPYAEIATPAARGNRAFGDYLTGSQFFGALQKTVENHHNITIQENSPAVKLLVENGKCVGVVIKCFPSGDNWSDVNAIQNMLHEIGSGSAMFGGRKVDEGCRQREKELLEAFGVEVVIRAKKGVIISCGGYYFNQEMISEYAPKYNGFMPLGNLGDDGSGIKLAQEVGAKLDRMDRCSAWKFINPPYSFVRGILVNASGERVGNEDVYGASFADFLVQKHDGKGWLVVDQQMWEEANQDCIDPDSGLQEDQRMQGLANLHRNCKQGDSWNELATECGMDPSVLKETVTRYNMDASNGIDTLFGKKKMYLAPLKEGPFYAINLDMVGNKYWPTPCMSLGGIVVEGSTGRAISEETGEPIPGLYAAGRSAVGIASNYYVSGLSLGDCIFSGRRAGRHAGSQ